MTAVNFPPCEVQYLRRKLHEASVCLVRGGNSTKEFQPTAVEWRIVVEEESMPNELLEVHLESLSSSQRTSVAGVWRLLPIPGVEPVHAGQAWHFPFLWEETTTGVRLSEQHLGLEGGNELTGEEGQWFVGVERVTVAILGCGNRGNHYATYAKEYPEIVRVVAIADEKPLRRRSMQSRFPDCISSRDLFEDWEGLASIGKRIADAVVLSLPDRLHKVAAVAMGSLGYHLLLEKPMATTLEDCFDIVETAEKNGCLFAVCHVLRYTPYSRLMKELIASGTLGTITHIQHLEPIGYYHFAHSYVRGNWRNEATSSFSLLTKSCHDLDWIMWMMAEPCLRVSSFGSLLHFKEESAPEGAGSRCSVDCPAAVEQKCPYSAVKVYQSIADRGNVWPVNVIVDDTPTVESVKEALRRGPYGVCVYKSDNDVCDQQVVSLQFVSGATASFSMVAHTEELCVRKTRVFGSHGQLEGDGTSEIRHVDFRTRETTIHRPAKVQIHTAMTGHGYGDYHLMKDFINAVRANDQGHILSGLRETLASHALVFAAEKARKEQTVESLSQ